MCASMHSGYSILFFPDLRVKNNTLWQRKLNKKEEWNLSSNPFNETHDFQPLRTFFFLTLYQNRHVSHTEKQAFVSTVAWSISLHLNYDCWKELSLFLHY